MSIKKDGSGKWYLCIDKKGIPRVRRTFETKKQAEEFEREYLTAYKPKPNAEHTEKPSDKRRLNDLIELWFQYHGVNLSDGERRRRALDDISRELKNPIASELTSEQIVAWRYAKLQKGLSKKTCNNLHGYLGAMFSKLADLKVIDCSNPLTGIDFIKIQERQLSYLSHGQITQLFASIEKCANPSTYWVTHLCLRTGARWGEAEQLRFKQLHDGRVTYEFTKSKKVRSIPLDPYFYEQLLKFVRGKNPDDRVFSNCIGSFRRAVVRAKLDLPAGQCSHILRHSFASHFVINGGNILSLQRILGHATIEMTMRYAHLAPDHLNDAVRLNPIAIGC